jgi:hypothetical protein
MTATDLLAGWLIGMQLASAHYGTGASDLEWATPGIYAVHPSGATASVYRNSHGRASVMAGYTWQWLDGRLALTLGAVTGYGAASVLPVLLPSLRLPLQDGWGLRVTLVPPIKEPAVTGAITLGIDRQF